jgi:hypothetical protein
MGYTGWLMPDGVFYSCKHMEHRELLRKLLEKPQYKYLMEQNIEKGRRYNDKPEGVVCFWDTNFQFADFEGEMTEKVEDFLIKHFAEFNDKQKLCIYHKFYILENKTKKQKEALEKFKKG